MAVALGLLGGVARLLFLDAWTMSDDPHLGASVQPSLAAGDTVLGLTNGTPSFGELVRCTDPEDATRFVLGRVAGLAGDEVHTDGRELSVNGTRFDAERGCVEPTFTILHPVRGSKVVLQCDQVRMGGGLHLRASSEKAVVDHPAKTIVPPAKLFLISDNRNFHDDSRDFGTVPLASCKWRVFFRLWGKEGWTDEKRRLMVVR